MTISDDTDDLLSISLWGEVVTIIRNIPEYADTGTGIDFWDIVSEPNADIQRISGNNPIRRIGQGRFSSHAIFLPDGTNVKQGDRIRSSDWSIGRSEYFVQSVLADEGHTEVRVNLVESQEVSSLDGPLGLLLGIANI